MKQKLTALVMMIVLAISALPNVTAAAEEYEGPITLSVDTYFGTPDEPEPAETTLVWEGTYITTSSGGGFSFIVVKSCDAVDPDDCYNGDTYFDVQAHMEWATPYPSDPGFSFYYKGNLGPEYSTINYDCGTATARFPVGGRGECDLHASGILPADEVDPDQDYPITVSIGPTVGIVYVSIEYKIIISTEPIDICEDDYVPVGESVSGNIDPTSETGATETIIPNKIYQLTVAGLWNDGGGQRTDAAYRQGTGTLWKSFEQAVDWGYTLCDTIDNNSSSIIFTAASNTLHVRANDTEGNFANNTGALTYTLSVVQAIGQYGCQGQFVQGVRIGTVTLEATNSSGVSLTALQGWPFPGSWVIAKVTEGAWQNNGSGAERTDLALKVGSGNFGALSEYENTGCYDEVGKAYYIQVESRSSHKIRVNDTDGVFNTNTGTLTVELYKAGYSPYQSNCEALYKTGTFIESKNVASNNETGVTMGDGRSVDLIGAPMGGEGAWERDERYFMLEVAAKPFSDGDVYHTEGEINIGSTWYEVSELPMATCVSQLDQMGRVRIYFPYSSNLYNQLWKFRAHDLDENYANNFGMIGYSLYHAEYIDNNVTIPPGEMPPDDGCDHYSHAETGTTITLDAQNNVGYTLRLAGGNIYAIQTSGGPWLNDEDDSYEIAISDDNGASWSMLWEYPLILCAKSTDANHAIVYIQTLAGKRYKLRVNDEGGDFNDNDESIDAILYTSETDIHDWNACSEDYIASEIIIPDASRTIPAINQGGVNIPYIQTGHTYGLEITDEHTWRVPVGTYNYGAEVSDDDAATWQDMWDTDFDLCTVLMSESGDSENGQARFRIYFTASGTYRLRVNYVPPFPWTTNIGYLMYRLYEVQEIDVLPDETNADNYISPNWATSCYEECQKPEGLFVMVGILPIPDVMGWLEYGRCALQQYLSWCPEHTETLLASMSEVPEDREPIATTMDLLDLFKSVRDAFVGYSWYEDIRSVGGEPDVVLGGEPGESYGGEESGSSSITITDFLLPGVNPDNDIWFGGELDLTGSNDALGGEIEDKALVIPLCTEKVENDFGDMGESYCIAMYYLRYMKVVAILTTVISTLVVIYMVFKYLPNLVRRWWDLIGKAADTLGKI